MTDTTIDGRNTDPFWTRVTAALQALRPAQRERLPVYGQPAMVRSLGLKPRLGTRIDEELASGWASAAGRHVSLSLLVIEIDRMADYFTAYGKPAADDCVNAVMHAIAEALPRPGDTCLRWGGSTFVVVLPDLPVLMARANAARIHDAVRRLGLSHKESHAGAVTVSMGLVINNPRGTYERKFFQTALNALKKAQRKGLGRTETIDLRPAQERKRKKAA